MDQRHLAGVLPRLAHTLFLCLIIFGLGSCGGEEATETARACASSNLIDCPVGSPEVTPPLRAAVQEASGSVVEQNGEVVGGCRAVGEALDAN